MNNSHYISSIAVCTFNRSDFLEICLESILNNKKSDQFEILVIDNNSTDSTYSVVKKFQDNAQNVKYFFEEKTGLSYARNKAIENANSEFIAFLDDDCFITDTYLDRLQWLIENLDFDCLGGMYLPWYYVQKPKWISDDFGKMKSLYSDLSKVEEDYVAGGNMLFKKSVFIKVGLFPVEFGMYGNLTGYGEEDYVQEKIRKAGGSIYFDPELIVYHTVQKYKLSLTWQLLSVYINAQSNYLINNRKKCLICILYRLFKSVIATFIIRLPISIYRLLFDKNFYYQNLILFSIRPVVINSGHLKAYLKRSL
jgi:glycosyltransferase involved in cell wall biosynthesis